MFSVEHRENMVKAWEKRRKTPKVLPSGVYAIFNCVTGEAYIGASSSVNGRLQCQRNRLRKSYRNDTLQRAWDEYGESSFKFLVLQRVPIDQLEECEERWLRTLRPAYNRMIGKTFTLTREERDKIAESNRRRSRKSIP